MGFRMMLLREVKTKRLTVMPPVNGVGFVLQWIGATFLLWVIGVFLVTLQAVMGMVSFFALGLMGLFSVWLLVLLAGATLGWLAGMLQTAVMQEGSKFIPGWQTATIIGGTIGVPLALLANRILGASGLDRALAGEIGLWLPLLILLLCMSVTQGITLFVRRKSAGTWLLATLISALVYALLQGIFWPLAVALQAGIQGVALWHLLREEPGEEQAESSATQVVYAHR